MGRLYVFYASFLSGIDNVLQDYLDMQRMNQNRTLRFRRFALDQYPRVKPNWRPLIDGVSRGLQCFRKTVQQFQQGGYRDGGVRSSALPVEHCGIPFRKD